MSSETAGPGDGAEGVRSLSRVFEDSWASLPFATLRPTGSAPRRWNPGPDRQEADLSSSVVLVGHSRDEHLDGVSQALSRRGVACVRVVVDPRAGSAAFDDTPSATQSCRAVLCRWADGSRPVAHHMERAARTTDALSAVPVERRAFAAREWRLAILGWLDGLQTGRWMNDLWAAQRADLKLAQLRAAAESGLSVPSTVVTDDPAVVRRFHGAAPDGIVYKCLSDPVVWEHGQSAGFLYTSVVNPGHLEGAAALSEPGVFQERLRARAEYRVTVVGERVFAARLRPPGGLLDWRRAIGQGLRYERAVLDGQVEAAVRATLSRLGLRFAAVDLLETDHDVVFLELNPAGAYGWLERILDLPVTEAVCDDLLEGGGTA